MGFKADDLHAVILAGGEGSRLRPLTVDRPKPMLPVGNVPILEHLITHLKKHGIKRITLAAHYLAAEIESYFGDGANFGVEIDYFIESVPMGTAGAIRAMREMIGESTALVLSGDALTNADFEAAHLAHRAKQAKITLLLSRVESPLEFGVVVMDADKRIVGLVEKPTWAEVVSDTVNTGMYFVEPEVLSELEAERILDWSGDVFPQWIAANREIYGHVIQDYWSDVGSFAQYSAANLDVLSGVFATGDPPTEDGVRVGAFSVIDEAAKLIPPVIIGRNCRVKAGAVVGPDTVIGDNVLIEEGAQVQRSIVWDSTYIGANANLESTIVASRVTIKRIAAIQEESVIGDRCTIEAGAKIRPRVKLWPDKTVERGAVVTHSLVWGTRYRAQLFRDLGVAGISNVEITPDFAVRLGAAIGSRFPRKTSIVTSRDSTRSSRMVKRAIISSLLSVGLDVVDLRSMAVPVARHYISRCGAGGAIHVRKLPGNSRVTLIETFDQTGAYINRRMERDIENAFNREDFRRADSDELGVIDFAGRAVEGYQADFHRLLDHSQVRHRMRVVCDFGFSALAGVYPSMLARLNVDAVSLNAFNDAKRAPRSPEDQSRHIAELRGIIQTLPNSIGVVFFDEGERLVVVDDRGRVVEGHHLAAAMLHLVRASQKQGVVVASSLILSYLNAEGHQNGVEVIGSKSDVRSIMEDAAQTDVLFASDERGGFIFPGLHPGFDAAFAFAKLLSLLQSQEVALSEIVDQLPFSAQAYEQVHCPSPKKGTVMRSLHDWAPSNWQVSLEEGIRFSDQDSWIQVIPDVFEPTLHVYVEAKEDDRCADLMEQIRSELVRSVEAASN
jgi:mannose-1-phosphate guanylyltransferase/phosphomannomutase